MNTFIIFCLIIALLGFIFILRQVDYIYHKSDFLLLVRFCAVSLFINVIVFFYLTATFKHMDTKPGPQGPIGNRGERGLEGQADTCLTCETQQNTVGHDFLKDRLENQVIIEKPLLDPQAAERDPWKDILGKRVKIYTNKNNTVCGLQWTKRIAGLSVLKSTDKSAILDCEGNSDIFTITKEGTKYYIQNILGEAKEETGTHQKIKKTEIKCSMGMTKRAGGTPFTRGTEHTGIFSCSEKEPIYLRGTPKSFRILIVNENDFTCEAKSSNFAGQLNDIESYERLLKFNCIEEGETFYLELI